jgi:hypothetical protein
VLLEDLLRLIQTQPRSLQPHQPCPQPRRRREVTRVSLAAARAQDLDAPARKARFRPGALRYLRDAAAIDETFERFVLLEDLLRLLHAQPRSS